MGAPDYASERLRDRYDGVEAVLEDVAVATEITGTLHRPAGDGEPWCKTPDTGVEYVDMAVALEHGGELCKGCFRAALAHLARMDDSPVEDTGPVDTEAEDTEKETPTPGGVNTGVEDPGAGSGDTEPPTANDDVPGERLDAVPREVLVAGAGAIAYHAPAGEDRALCGRTVDGRRRKVEHTPPSTRPCQECFTERLVDAYSGRDRPSAPAATDGGVER
jgi:hypothetical protein